MSSSLNKEAEWPPPPGSEVLHHMLHNANSEDNLPEPGGEAGGLPENWLAAMATFAMGHHNDTRDLSLAVLKPIVNHIYPVFMVQYGLLMMVGAIANILVIFHVLREKLYRDATHAFVLNLVLSHCVQCLVVVPLTLMVLLVQNWIFGQFLCYFLPMLQVS